MSHGLSRWRIEAQLKAVLPTPLRTMECLGFPGAKTPDIFIYLAFLGSTGQRNVFSSTLRADLGRCQLQGVGGNAAVSRGAGLLATRRRSRTLRWPSRTGLKQDGGARKAFPRTWRGGTRQLPVVPEVSWWNPFVCSALGSWDGGKHLSDLGTNK